MVMSNYIQSTLSVECPACGFITPIPAAMTEYNWKKGSSYTATESWFCVNCGEENTVTVKRRICDVVIGRSKEEDHD